jgi:hypothetical protein
VEKYCTARQATDGNIIWRMRAAWWMTGTTERHSEYVTLTAFAGQQWFRQCSSILRHRYLKYTLSYEGEQEKQCTRGSGIWNNFFVYDYY